jgi:glutamate dehydrogenase
MCAFFFSFQQVTLAELFLRHVLKTNFYQPTKVALSFRLAPDFLPETEYPKRPFGMFFVIGRNPLLLVVIDAYSYLLKSGNEFRGFHIRFRDVARGGIRIVRSRNRE